MTSTELPAPTVRRFPRQPDYRASRAAFIEHAAIVSRMVRTAALRDVFTADMDTDLIVVLHTWSEEAGENARAYIAEGHAPNTYEGWQTALGVPTETVLTEDGLGTDVKHFCTCESMPGTAGEFWVRYERWTQPGRTAHGFVCKDCRRLKQTG